MNKYPENEVFDLRRIKVPARRTLYLKLGTVTLEWRPGFETGWSKHTEEWLLSSYKFAESWRKCAAGGEAFHARVLE